jgi:trimeric autotransporter adhesin
MRFFRLPMALPAVLCLSVLVSGCTDAATSEPLTPGSGAGQLRVSPRTLDLLVNDTFALSVTVPSQNGTSEGPVRWSSSSTAIAGVTANGTVNAVAPGSAVVYASRGLLRDSVMVLIGVSTVQRVVAAPKTMTLNSTGERRQLQAQAFDGRDRSVSTPLGWRALHPGVVEVDGTGMVTARSTGTTMVIVSALCCAVADTVMVDVSPVAAAVTVAPQAATVLVHDELQLEVSARDQGGVPVAGRPASWSSSDAAIASVSALGVVTALKPGVVRIGATVDGVTGHADLAVMRPPVAMVVVVPAALALQVQGTQQLTAQPQDAEGRPLQDRTCTWSSSNPGTANVSNAGLVTGVAAGAASIVVSCEGVTATVPVTVTAAPPAPVASISLSPSGPSVVTGATVQLSATLKDAAGNTLTGRPVTWSSSSAGVASVSAAGVVTGLAAGSATVTATSEGRSAQAAVTVTAPPPVAVASITLSPSAPSVVTGGTVQLAATLKDAAGNTLAGRTVTWSSSSAAVASVSAAGVVTGVAAGSATITATSEGRSAQAAITVTAPPPVAVASITLSPASASVAVGGTVQLSATLKDAAGNTLTGRTVTWSSSNPVAASVSASGLVSGASAGTVTITASAEGRQAHAQVAVTGASNVYHVPASIAADCSVDVTGAVRTWIATVPDNSTLRLGANACYLINGGLVIDDRHGLTFDGNNATFKFTTQGHGQRSHWMLRGGSGYTFRDITLIGANPNAGTGNAAYVSGLEWQHGWRFRGTQGALLDNVQVYDVYGDFVNVSFDDRVRYPGPPTRNIVVRNSRFERNGRYGWTITHGEGIVFENNYMGDVRWSGSTSS